MHGNWLASHWPHTWRFYLLTCVITVNTRRGDHMNSRVYRKRFVSIQLPLVTLSYTIFYIRSRTDGSSLVQIGCADICEIRPGDR
ncbi:hypothetical protein K474DRAFT_1654381 [Panus rudis PR-1116 ss-1]|nr:hypothetical protein K474DRAFT_1654381 [Panus rudis PR-1116 ss-1]